MVRLVNIYRLPAKVGEKSGKKFEAKFDVDGKRVKVRFGAYGSQTFLEGATNEQKSAYIARHGALQKMHGNPWDNNPMSASTLSRYILWEFSDFGDSIKGYRQRFGV